jgi:sulfur carrier protein
MKIKVNGKDESIEKPVNLMELVLAKGLIPEHVVVEHNFSITSKSDWQSITLKEDDNVEIVSFVGGG